MFWSDLPRVPEPEVMDDAEEVSAYSSAAAQEYLSHIDDSFVRHALRLARHSPGLALDIGSGPGEIVCKLARHLKDWQLIGVDYSENMIRAALQNLRDLTQGSQGNELPAGRLDFMVADANRLPFLDGTFDLVVCNSVLHHMAEPGRLFVEMARVAKPSGAMLLRDLRRPSRFAYPFHVRWHGRHYLGTMYKLYCSSVRAAYTCRELEGMLRSSGVHGVRVFALGATHIGFERESV